MTKPKPKTRKSKKPRGYRFEHVEMGRGKVIYPVKPKPQTTIVQVAVTTAGPVSMKAVREWVGEAMDMQAREYSVNGTDVLAYRIKRDANRER